MKKISDKIRKWAKKNQNWLSFLLFLISGMILTLYVEYKFQYAQFKWLELRILIISGAIVRFGAFSRKSRKKLRPLILKALLFVIILYVLNLLANSVNVYHLYRFEKINTFCQESSGVCAFVSDNFYRFKFYRFVSLTPYFFFYVIFLLIGMLFPEKMYRQANRIWQKMPKAKLRYTWLFYFLITFLIFKQLVLVFSIMSKTTIKITNSLRTPFQERWEPAMGGRLSFGWIDTYSNFVNSQVEEDSIILIPNQEAPWEMEGNPNYIRWFFYPRRTVQMLDSDEIPPEADYILVTYGVFGYKKNVFPNFSIEKEKISEIVLINRETLEKFFIEPKDFDPKNFEDKWGVIKLKKIK